MSQGFFSCTINAPFDKIWEILLDEVENPQRYSQKILDAKILERFHDGVLRLVSVRDADVRERVEYNYQRKEITSTLVGHPNLNGTTTRKITSAVADEPPFTVDCSIDWQSNDSEVANMIRRNVESFATTSLTKIKELAEK
jgi:hypothetical protein